MALIPQLIINGLIAGAIYALMAASFSLIFNTLKFMDLSPGALFVLGSFTTYTLNVILGLNLTFSILITLIFISLIAVAINKIVYKPLRQRKADTFTLLLSSYGIFLFITSIILIVFGSESRTFNFTINKGHSLLGFIITNMQIILILSSLLLFVLLWLFMKKTKTGKALRAISDNKQIASTLGINVEKYTSLTFIISALFAGIAGILIGIEQTLSHNMGFSVILKGITASIIGGIGSVSAALIGGFIIGLVENIGIAFLPSGYKDGIAFVILIIFLLFRPQGLLGFKTREEVSG